MVPAKYRLRLIPMISDRTIDGSVEIDVGVVEEGVSSVTLHSVEKTKVRLVTVAIPLS